MSVSITQKTSPQGLSTEGIFARDFVRDLLSRPAAKAYVKVAERAHLAKQRRFIKDMEKLGYEVTGIGPDGKFTFAKVKTWQDGTTDRISNGAPNEAHSSSSGTSRTALASAQRALRAAKKLKSSSANGCKREDKREAGRVIPLKCS